MFTLHSGVNVMVATSFFCIFMSFFYCGIAAVVYENAKLPLDLGSEVGIQSSTGISSENVALVLKGVETGNKDSIYYYALLKLYGTVNSTSTLLSYLP